MAIAAIFKGPVVNTPLGELQTYTMSAEERIAIVRNCDNVQALRRALDSDSLQKSVEYAIRSRLRRLGSVA